MGQLDYSPAVAGYLERHAVDPGLAHGLGVRSDRDDLLYPYSTPLGETFVRRRDLASGITKQPNGEPLILWWPAGRPERGEDVLLCEGEPDALAALSALNGSGMKVAALPGTAIPADRVTGELGTAKTVYLAMDGDEAGRKAADRLARSLQQFTHLKVVQLGEGEDLASRLFREDDREGWLSAALEGAKAAPRVKLKEDPQGYGREKPADKLRDLLAKGIDPEKLDLGELLTDVQRFIRRYVHMTEAQAATVALWLAHTHALDASRVTPYLSINSAEPGSGKTLLLEVLAMLAPRPWLTGRTTAAVLPRKVEALCPTLLLDESDTAFRGDKDYASALHGILNSGYKRSGSSTLCVGQGANIDFRDFSTFCPKAFAGIAKLPDTVRARAFSIRLVKIADESVEEFDEEEVEPTAQALRDRLEAFTLRGVGRLRGLRPDRLEGVDPRTKEIAKPLLQVADLAGGEWPGRARRALLELDGGEVEDPTIGVELLRDIRGVFDALAADRITSKELRAELIEMEGSPWSEWRQGNPISQRAITDRLKPYGITKRNVRFGDDASEGTVTKGYHRDQFEDAWKRYLPKNDTQTGYNGYNGATEPRTASPEPATEPLVLPVENARKPHGNADVAGVAGSGASPARPGCPSHPDGPHPGCRYCEAAS